MPAMLVVPAPATDPDGVRMRRITPMTADPVPAAVPDPFAVEPDIFRPRRDHRDRLHRYRGWRLRDVNGGATRGLRGRADSGGRADHVIDHLVAHASITQVDDVRR